MKDLPDEINWVKFSAVTWTNDSKGFFYGRFAEPKEESLSNAGMGTQKLVDMKIYYHRLGQN
jgi:prolyl oligopeptidase